MSHAMNGPKQEVKNYFELLELILENNTQAIQVCNKFGQFVYMNKLANKFFLVDKMFQIIIPFITL